MNLRAFVVALCSLVPVTAFASNDLIDEEWVIPASSYHSATFVLSHPSVVHVDMQGEKHTDKGVTLGICPPEDVDACSGNAHGQCRMLGAFEGLKVKSYDHTATVPAGRWAYFVANTENVMFAATVQTRVTIGN